MGHGPRGHKESDTTERLSTAQWREGGDARMHCESLNVLVQRMYHNRAAEVRI